MQLQRITTSGRYIPEVDGLRFVSIAYVVLFHFYGYILARNAATAAHPLLFILVAKGRRGVYLFFALSGFILGGPFARARLAGGPPVDLRKYFARRLTRLEPPYMLVMAGLAVYLGLRNVWPHLLASLTYTHNLFFSLYPFSGVNGVAWSLEIEVQFYCLAPLLAAYYLLPRWRRYVLLAALPVICCIQSFLHFEPMDDGATLTLAYFVQYFAAGMLLADVYVSDWKDIPRHWLWDTAGAALWPLLFLLPRVYFQPIGGPLIFLLYLSAFKGPAASWLLRRPAVTTIGGMCYTIYLLHVAVMKYTLLPLVHLGMGTNYWAWFGLEIALLGVALGPLCFAFFVLVERPCMRPDWPRVVLDKCRAVFTVGRLRGQVLQDVKPSAD